MNRGAHRARGQIALETVIIIGFVLALMIPLIYMLYTRVNIIQENLRVLEAVRAMDSLSSAAATVGVLGPNGSASVDIVLPEGMINLSIGKTHPREMVLSLMTSLGDIDIVKMLPYNVSESTTAPINKRPGKQTAYVIHYENGSIEVTSMRPSN